MQLKPFKLERFFSKYEFSTRYLLCSSDCESVSVGDLLDLEPAAEKNFKQHWLGYTESNGAPELRREICRIYANIQPEQVLVHSGAEEAIFLFMHATLNAGDHVVVYWPCYQSLSEIAKGIGCEVSLWEAREENVWTPDLDELRRVLRRNTRAVIINTPHNPSGNLMTYSLFMELNILCLERGILLFSDEVYRELEYNREERLPSACDINPTAVALGVMSKTYGLAGLRIGWIATQNDEVRERMAELKDYTTICNSGPSEFLAELALRHREKLIERNLQIICSNLFLLDDFFARYSDHFTWVRPTAGPIGFPKLLKKDAEVFCDELVRETSVLLLPSILYDYPDNHFRIGFARRNMPEALALVDRFLEVNR